MKPTYTHNHVGGIKTDGSCPRCNSYAEDLAKDQVINLTANTEDTVQIIKTAPQEWYPES
jgi:hypothetical protein